MSSSSKAYRANEKKLDSSTVSCYFIGYSKRPRSYKFYNPTIKSIFKSGNAQFFVYVKFLRRGRGRDITRDFDFEKKYVDIRIVIGIDQDFILDLVQDTIDQDDIGKPLIQEIIPEE